MDDVVQTIFRAVKIFQDGRYSRAAAMTLLSCDITSNFADEVEYIWRARWTLIKVLYIFARYYALGNLSCKGFFDYSIYAATSALGNMVHTVVVDLIFVLRISALWAQDRKGFPSIVPSYSLFTVLFFVGTMLKFRDSVTLPGSNHTLLEAVKSAFQANHIPNLSLFILNKRFGANCGRPTQIYSLNSTSGGGVALKSMSFRKNPGNTGDISISTTETQPPEERSFA
ncbi:hypothetical protein DFP72DRAFT_906634 [Ephemerocybe angulata]|uniref:DUF6533 domain-containing protein n=1 Tax=Ephemerocybe angulata TaxID=980116 RepID=A0A8H6M1F8_9AGAR|nr:hypothetical protein DFP72DRAFT_906634 [Tulosesus angulatus]